VDRPDHVVHRILVRPRDREAHVGLRREMEAPVRAEVREDIPQRLADVVVDEVGVGRDMLAEAARQVVDHEHVVSAGHQRVGHV
jgi:hypothetical protein